MPEPSEETGVMSTAETGHADPSLEQPEDVDVEDDEQGTPSRTKTRKTRKSSEPRCLLCNAKPDGVGGLPLCATCREESRHRKFPIWVKIAAAVIAIPVVFAAVSFPGNLAGAVAYHRGEQQEALGHDALAVQEYGKAAEQFPKSTLVKAREGIAAYHAGLYDITERDFNAIAGLEAPSAEIADEVNAIIDEVSRGSTQQEQ